MERRGPAPASRAASSCLLRWPTLRVTWQAMRSGLMLTDVAPGRSAQVCPWMNRMALLSWSTASWGQVDVGRSDICDAELAAGAPPAAGAADAGVARPPPTARTTAAPAATTVRRRPARTWGGRFMCMASDPPDDHTVRERDRRDLERGVRLPGVQVHRRQAALAVGAGAGDRAGRVRHLADHDADAAVGGGEDPGDRLGGPGPVHQLGGVGVLVGLGAVVDPGLGAQAAGAVGVVARQRDAADAADGEALRRP